MLIERHYEDFLSTKWQSLQLRIVRRLLKKWISSEYNRSVLELLQIHSLDALIVFKGMLLLPETLLQFQRRNIPCFCVYPDVSFKDHGRNIWDCLPHYDCILTTKAFHLDDEALRKRVRRLELVPHGFDPDVHRPIHASERMLRTYECDASFVGCWSEKKDRLLSSLVRDLPSVKLAVWGPAWERASSLVRPCCINRGAFGDELSAVYGCSKINLGLLSEAGKGTSTGDRSTARTWQIPASNGFLLHEDTEELRQAFLPDIEAGIFRGETDIASRVRYWLEHPENRERVRQAGLHRALSSGYSYATAADRLLEIVAESQSLHGRYPDSELLDFGLPVGKR